MTAVIIDYGSGNLHSTQKAFERMAGPLGIPVVVSDNPELLKTASHIVLPGVGAFGDCMAGIRAIPGMREGLEEEVRRRKKPFLGICVGMQLLAEKGLEHGEHEGLGWLPATVKPITPRNKNLKVPHMGWNDLDITNPHPLLLGLAADAHAYFVHSYVMDCRDKKDVLATVEYGGDLVAIVARGNIMGTQFHPEKSQQTGLGIIHNFLKLRQA